MFVERIFTDQLKRRWRPLRAAGKERRRSERKGELSGLVALDAVGIRWEIQEADCSVGQLYFDDDVALEAVRAKGLGFSGHGGAAHQGQKADQ